MKKQRVEVISNSKTVRCWRMKGYKEFMPDFAEEMMSSFEKIEGFLEEENVKLNASIESDNGAWILDIETDEYKDIHGKVVLSGHRSDCGPRVIKTMATINDDKRDFSIGSIDDMTYGESVTTVLSFIKTLAEMK